MISICAPQHGQGCAGASTLAAPSSIGCGLAGAGVGGVAAAISSRARANVSALVRLLAQGRDLRVHLRRPAARCELVHLEAAQIIPCCRIGRAAEKAGESLNVLEVIVLRLLAEPADGHVLEQAAAKIADRLVAHWGVLVLRLEVDEPLDPQDETLPITLPVLLAGVSPRRLPTPQQAGVRATCSVTQICG
jgi:hypothetical protein